MTHTSTEQTRKKCTNCNGTGSGKDGWDCLNCSGDGWVFAEPTAARTSTEQQEFGTQSKAEYVIEIRNLKRRIAELEASQARVPLSDEEIFNIYCQSDSELSTTAKNLTLFVRDIEAAHGITQETQG